MKTISGTNFGLYVPNENSMILRPTRYVAPADRRVILAFHGHQPPTVPPATGGELGWLPGWPGGDHTQTLADDGYTILSIDGGGGSTWNNNAMLAAADGAYNYALSTLGMAGTKVGLFGWSMGGGSVLQWLKSNAARVACCMAWAPMTDLDYFHANGTYTAEIDTAYGGNYAANSPGHKIADEYTTWRNKGAIRLLHGTADSTVPVAKSAAFVAGVGQPQVDLVQLAGADHTSLFGAYPTANTLSFFDAGAW